MAYVVTNSPVRGEGLSLNGYAKANFIVGKPYKISESLIVTDENGTEFQVSEGPYQTLTINTANHGPSCHHFSPALYQEGDLKINALSSKLQLKEMASIQQPLAEKSHSIEPFTITVKEAFSLADVRIITTYELSAVNMDTMVFRNKERLLEHLERNGHDVAELFQMPAWDIKITAPNAPIPDFMELNGKRNSALITFAKQRIGHQNISIFTAASSNTRFQTTNFGLAMSHLYEVLAEPQAVIDLLNNEAI